MVAKVTPDQPDQMANPVNEVHQVPKDPKVVQGYLVAVDRLDLPVIAEIVV